jgi:Uma2 family endonuclease
MTALMDLPGFRERVQPLSVETYHLLGQMGLLSKKVELLGGLVVKKMAKSPLHELVSHKLMKLLEAQAPAGFEVRREAPLTLGDSEPEPDLSVVAGNADDWEKAHPTTAALVAEVAVSDPSVDEGKADIYSQAGIPEYWLVRPEDRMVDVYREPSSRGYLSKVTLADTEALRSSALPGVEIAVEAILPKPSDRDNRD